MNQTTETLVKRARFVGQAVTARRALSVLLTLVLLPGIGLPAQQARAHEPSGVGHECDLEPDARVQLFIKHFIVFEDGDLVSSGEIHMKFTVRKRGLENCSDLASELVSSTISFSADSGDVKVLDRPIPRNGDTLGVEVTEAFGLPLYAGARYSLGFDMSESDSLCCQYNSPEGEIAELSAENGWLIGTHQLRTDYESSPAGTLSYEIRPMPLPDLRPTSITRLEIPGNSTDELVCMAVENKGPMEAGAFQAALYVNDQLAPNGVAQAGRLGAGQQGDLCVQTRLPANEHYSLSAVVDEPRGIIEINERNNTLERQFLGKQVSEKLEPSSGLSLEPANPNPSSTNQADLIIDAIRVKGKDPASQSDCDPGKNDVTIVVKNLGTSAAAPFAVRVAVGDGPADTDEQSVPGLDAGKSRDVTFDNFNLKKNVHTITANADVKKVVPESNETNNTKSETVTCQDES